MKGMKGVELPINILVIVAVAVVVLLGLVALYFVGWSPFPKTVGLESVKNDACRVLVQEKRCSGNTWTIQIANYDADGDGQNDGGTRYTGNCGDVAQVLDDNLFSLCKCVYGYTGTYNVIDGSCKKMCGCL